METDTTPDLTGPLPPRAYLRRCASEPYRILFPVGTIFGFLGVAVWPLTALGLAPAPLVLSHPRVMVEGFVGSFVIGYLATALPRLLGIEPLSGNLVIILASTLVSVGMFQLLGAQWVGDLLFTFSLLVPLVAFALRFGRRKGEMPPCFFLVLLGVVGAALGAFLQAERVTGMRIGPFLQRVSALLLLDGLPLLSLLGACAFFLPQVYAAAGQAEPTLPLRPFRERIRPALPAAGTGLLILASFLFDGGGMPRLGGLLRLSAAAGYLAFSFPHWAELRARGTVTAAVRLALPLALLGMLLAPFVPLGPAGVLHLLFLGGAGLMILATGAQVVYGLSGRGFLLRYRFLPFEFAIGGVMAALAARFGADYLPSWRLGLLSLSSLLWIGALGLWAFAVIPFVLCPDVEEKEESSEDEAASGSGSE